MRMAHMEKLPIGTPLEYDHAQYVHQVPGGVISNLRHQLRQIRMEQRLSEVLEESVRVRRDLGYPIMVTPFSQFVVSQATINVLNGNRYQVVTDEVIKYTLGVYGSEAGSGVTSEAREIILDRPRAKELAQVTNHEQSLDEIRESFGADVSDDELLLRYAVGGESDVVAMRSAGPIQDYSAQKRQVPQLVESLVQHKDMGSLRINLPGLSLTLERNGVENPSN